MWHDPADLDGVRLAGYDDLFGRRLDSQREDGARARPVAPTHPITGSRVIELVEVVEARPDAPGSGPLDAQQHVCALSIGREAQVLIIETRAHCDARWRFSSATDVLPDGSGEEGSGGRGGERERHHRQHHSQMQDPERHSAYAAHRWPSSHAR